MNGMEMMLNSLLKLLKIDQETINKTLLDLQKLGQYAQSVDTRLAQIEANQKRVLELLEIRQPYPSENFRLAHSAPDTIEEANNA